MLDQILKYRELNAQSKSLDAEIKVVRESIELQVKEQGDYSDDDGYAKMMSRSGGVS